jgi:alpha-glucosidase
MFTPDQPDWNWDHPDVAPMFEDVLRFWFDRGVDGFRIDAAQGTFKHPELPDVADPFEEERVKDATNLLAWNQPGTYELYATWRAIADEYSERDGVDRVLVGEITGVGQQHLTDYIRPDRLHQSFYFALLNAEFAAGSLHAGIAAGLDVASATESTATWVLGNHDCVRVATRYAGGAPGAGAGNLVLGAARARAAALLALALPGATYLYQGEELGLPEVVDLPEDRITDPIFTRSGGKRRGRDGCRVPLPWSGTAAPFGFSTTPDTWLPQPEYFAAYTADTQRTDPNSVWNLYQAALRLRREHLKADPELQWVESAPGVLAFGRGEHFLCAVNTTDHPVPAPHPGAPLLASGPVEPGFLPGNTAAWWIR